TYVQYTRAYFNEEKERTARWDVAGGAAPPHRPGSTLWPTGGGPRARGRLACSLPLCPGQQAPGRSRVGRAAPGPPAPSRAGGGGQSAGEAAVRSARRGDAVGAVATAAARRAAHAASPAASHPAWLSGERALNNPAFIAAELERRREGTSAQQADLDCERQHY